MGALCCCFRAKEPEDQANNSDNNSGIFDFIQNSTSSGRRNSSHSNPANKLESLRNKLTEKQLKVLGFIDGCIPPPRVVFVEECPTCLEEFTKENPRIVARCGHYFHLACIYEWKERSEKCPVCTKAMEFNEVDDDFMVSKI